MQAATATVVINGQKTAFIRRSAKSAVSEAVNMLVSAGEVESFALNFQIDGKRQWGISCPGCWCLTTCDIVPDRFDELARELANKIKMAVAFDPVAYNVMFEGK